MGSHLIAPFVYVEPVIQEVDVLGLLVWLYEEIFFVGSQSS